VNLKKFFKKRKILFLNFFIIFTFSLFSFKSQAFSEYSAPSINWKKEISFDPEVIFTRGVGIFENNQEEIVVFVQKLTRKENKDKTYLSFLKFDYSGNLKKEEEIFSISSSFSVLNAVQTKEQNYLILVGDNDSGVYLIKTDEEGNEIWIKFFQGLLYPKIKETQEGGYIIVGNRYNNSISYRKIVLLKINREGELEWEKDLKAWISTFANSFTVTSDNEYLIGGWTKAHSDDYPRAYLVKANSFGEKIWEKIIPPDYFTQVLETEDNNYLVGGVFIAGIAQGGNWTVFQKFDKDGNSIWGSSYLGDPQFVLETIEGNYLLGVYQSEAWWHQVYLAKYNKEGKKLWDLKLENLANALILQTKDGNYFVLGNPYKYSKSLSLLNLTSDIQIQKKDFEVYFDYNLDKDLNNFESRGKAKGTILNFEDKMKIEGEVSFEGPLPTTTPNIYLIATDGLKKELSSTTISTSSVSYSQIGEATYSFSVLISDPIKPENGGHYELYLEINGKPFFVNTNSRINRNYLPLTNLPEKIVLISEVYYDVARGKDSDNEWVIIRNLENEEINLSGWKICSKNEKEKCNNLEGIIPANGFAILTPTSTTFSFWKIPKEMTKIILGKKFGSYGLNNEGDNLILKNEKGEIVDAMSYGDDKSIFDPLCQGVAEGKSLLRDPPEKDTDTAEDFKESEPTIGKNQPPVSIINFSPKNPIRGVKVKFDASSSTDPDGEIKEFFWEIKIGEKILATSTATTITFAFPENGEYQITLTVTDNDGATSSTSTIINVEPFSFAIITDLHIGRGYLDYNGPGFDDGYNGEEYYLTQRLRNVVNWINQNKGNYSFKFVAVLGDIADTAEKSEFCKAKEILDDLEIPYIPLFGNHDVWPYTEKESAPGPLGEDFFERIFWSTSSIPCENASSTKNFENLLREFNFERDIQNPKFKNFAFTFGGIHFIGLDFNSREKEEKWYLGPTGAKGEAVTHPETIEWLREKLNELEGKEPVIILSHEPFAWSNSRKIYGIPWPKASGNFSDKELDEIVEILENYENKFNGQQILSNFGGHIHGFEKAGKELKFFGQFSPIDLYFDANWQYPSLSTVPVLTTEALMVGGNEKDLSKKGLIRIVKIEEKEKINFSDIEFKEPALNPYIAFDYKILPDKIFPCVRFVGNYFSKRELAYFFWDFGDGEYKKLFPPSTLTDHCYSPLAVPATYTVTFTVADKETGITESITRKIEIKEGIIPKIIKIGEDLKNKVEFISAELGEQVTEFGRTMRDWIWVKVKHSPSTPVGLINIHFENATEDIDLSQLKADIDFQNKKSLLYMPEWPLEIERSKILLIPK
jgi:predicted MPP superfamily phosphohydrolase